MNSFHVVNCYFPSLMSNRESYGVDIQDSHTEESSYRSDDDEYEDSFIDDDEQQNFSPSPSPSPVSRRKGIFYRNPRLIVSVFYSWMLILDFVNVIYKF